MEKYFDIVVNENDETGVDFNSFVDHPAHEKSFIAFNKNTRYTFNDEKRIVTGVAIAANKWIYRNDEVYGEHYVRFTPETIETIRKKFFAQGFNNNVNVDHDMKKTVEGAFMIDSYIVSNSDPKLPNVPEAFSKQGIEDGSWLVSYYITDDKLWNDVKGGKVIGFSVEGWFDKQKVNFKQQIKMSKPTKTVWQLLFGATEEKTQFAQVTAIDGTVLMYDGDLAEGTAMFIDENGEQVAAGAGDYQVTLEDGAEKIVTLDEAGVVTAITDVQEMGSDEPTVAEQIAEVMKKVLKDTDERFKAIEKENKELKSQVEGFKSQIETFSKGGKFEHQGKKTEKEAARKTASDLLNLNK